jgi:hypothetical protein
MIKGRVHLPFFKSIANRRLLTSITKKRIVMETKKCKFCGEDIIGKREDAVFCSNTCKAKHWEQKKESKSQPVEKIQEKKDVTSQLRGLLNGTIDETGTFVSGKTQQGYVKTIVPIYHELRNPLDAEIRRLTDVRKQLVSGIEKRKEELEVFFDQNGNKWIWGMTGTGALIGNVSSENKTQGTILGGTIGAVGGVIMKSMTTNIREEEKRNKAEKKVAEINNMIADLNNLDKKILSHQEKIRTIPFLQKKEILVPASSDPMKQPNLIVSDINNDELKPLPRLQNDVSDVCLTATNSEKIINSYDLKKMDFKILDFRDKWNAFFGYPSVTFHCIIHGLPGEGKSTFAIQFAKYLAENIGRVVYISGEEGITKTLKDKFMNNDGISRYLDIADLRTFDDIIKNIQPEVYNFIFIDSLDNMRIDAEKMKKIRERYKNSALITISQSTKDGKIRGSQELVHDCDIAVMVENGIAKTNKNRFKERGMEFSVFHSSEK